MATNRKRTKRVPKSKIPQTISPAYRKKLELKDYLGVLEEHEIPVAIQAGVHRWNLWAQANQVTVLTGDLHSQGYRLAPVFGPDGKVAMSRYPGKVRFIVNDYDELDAYNAHKAV